MAAEVGDLVFNGVKGSAGDLATSESINASFVVPFLLAVAGYFAWV